MNTEFTPQEITMLKELVEVRLAELGPEIHHTHYRAYRDGLKAMREKLHQLHEHLVAIAT